MTRLLLLVFLTACGPSAAIPEPPPPPADPPVEAPPAEPAPEPIVEAPPVEPPPAEPIVEAPPKPPAKPPVRKAPVTDPPPDLLRCKQDSDCIVSCADDCCGAPCGCHSTLTAAADKWYRDHEAERCGDARRECPPVGCAYEQEFATPRCASGGRCTLSQNRLPGR